jgi:hypothetical protein
MATNNFSTAFCILMTEMCISLSFPNLASKFYLLLITTASRVSNQIQREFYSNDAIASQELFLYSTCFAKLTNLLKQFTPFPCEAGRPAVTSRGQEGKAGGCYHFASIVIHNLQAFLQES